MKSDGADARAAPSGRLFTHLLIVVSAPGRPLHCFKFQPNPGLVISFWAPPLDRRVRSLRVGPNTHPSKDR